MPRDYWAVFTSGAPSTTSGLAPTFITFINGGGSNITPPSVSEPGTKGLYKFSVDVTQTIAFVLDGATTSLGSGSTVRYLSGVLDPQDTFGSTLTGIGATVAGYNTLFTNLGSTLVAIGNTSAATGVSLSAVGVTQVAIGNTLLALGTTFGGFGTSLVNLGALIGTTASSFGSTSVDPVDLFGFLKRAQEFQEGNQTYAKATGILDFYSRGSSTLLREKTVSDTSTQTTKT
jgi:hypothetical protein